MTFSKFTEFKHHNLFLENFHHPQNNKLICSQDLLFLKNVIFEFIFGCFIALRILFSPTRDGTCAPCSGRAKSEPLDYQEVPQDLLLPTASGNY